MGFFTSWLTRSRAAADSEWCYVGSGTLLSASTPSQLSQEGASWTDLQVYFPNLAVTLYKQIDAKQ